jgi:AraC-like DNA-binding protein
MDFTVADIFFIIVIFQLLFTSLFLFTHTKGKKISNLLLGAFFLSICLNLTDNFLFLRKIYLLHPLFVFWGICLPLLFGPLLYLYTRSVLFRDFRLSGKTWLHFLPFVLLFLFTETIYILQPRMARLKTLDHINDRNIPVYLYWSSSAIFLQFFIYVSASQKLIRNYRKLAHDRFSDRKHTHMTWLYSTLVFFTLCMIISALNGFVGLTPFAKYYYIILTVIIGLMLVFISRVLLGALKHPDLFSVDEVEMQQMGMPQKDRNQEGPGADAEDRKRLLSEIRQYMQTNKPWLNPELSLEQLAAGLSLRPKILSRVINELLQQNFFDFINRYRIEEAQRLLTDPPDKKITVLEVLYECGFNSKSSFNTLFKKHTGLTPSEFKKKNMPGR